MELDGIAVVALSVDTVAEVRAHAERDGLGLTLLSDAKLQAIDRLGLRHDKALPFATFTVAGIPLGYPVRPKSMAIPTTFLVDGEGVVRWIDQAEDYRIRGDEERVRKAVEQHLG